MKKQKVETVGAFIFQLVNVFIDDQLVNNYLNISTVLRRLREITGEVALK